MMLLFRIIDDMIHTAYHILRFYKLFIINFFFLFSFFFTFGISIELRSRPLVVCWFLKEGGAGGGGALVSATKDCFLKRMEAFYRS